MNRDALRRMMESAVTAGDMPSDELPDVSEMSSFGSPEEIITTAIDVSEFLGTKRASMAAHASQISETRSEEHTSELQSLMRISYAVFCLKKKKKNTKTSKTHRRKK